MKKVLSLFLLLCGITVSASAFTKKDFSLSITPEFGASFGTVKEYVDFVYAGQIYGLSELDYDFGFPYVGAELDAKLFKWVYVGGYAAIGFPVECGIMQDYDWQNRIFTGTHPYINALTNYSWSKSDLENYFEARLNLGMNVDLPLRINLRPYVSLQYVDIKFSLRECHLRYAYPMYNYGNGNYFYYPIGISSYENHTYGNVGSYNLYYADSIGNGAPAFAFGLKFDIQTIPFLDLQGNVGVLPLLTVADLDFHKLRSLYFLGVATPALSYYADLSLSIKLGRVLAFGVKGSLSVLPKVSGVQQVKSTNQLNYTKTSAFEGMEMTSGKLSLILSLTL